MRINMLWSPLRSYYEKASHQEPNEDVDGNSPTIGSDVGPIVSKVGRHWRVAWLSATATLLLLVAVGLIAQREVDFECGTTVEEAHAKGCCYEPMQRAWIPNACYFEQPSDEYSPFRDRTWDMDENLTIQADPAALEAGDVYVAYVDSFRQEHCTYSWRKLAIAVKDKRTYIDSRVGDIHHATNCALGLAEQTKNYFVCRSGRGSFTKSNLNFLKCVRL